MPLLIPIEKDACIARIFRRIQVVVELRRLAMVSEDDPTQLGVPMLPRCHAERTATGFDPLDFISVR